MNILDPSRNIWNPSIPIKARKRSLGDVTFSNFGTPFKKSLECKIETRFSMWVALIYFINNIKYFTVHFGNSLMVLRQIVDLCFYKIDSLALIIFVINILFYFCIFCE